MEASHLLYRRTGAPRRTSLGDVTMDRAVFRRIVPKLITVLPAAATFVASVLLASAASATAVSDWNNAALAEVRLSKALRNGPPMVARALAIAHTCMFDAWAAYDPVAVGPVLGGNPREPPAERTDANKAKAISFAAYRCLLNLYPDDGSYNVPPAPTPPTPSERLRAVLVAHGYDPSEAPTLNPTTPP